MNTYTTRPAAVVGMFYPEDPHTLSRDIDQLLRQFPTENTGIPKALIVPHAGTIYSGLTAAAAYTQLRPSSAFNEIVLLGPTHRIPLIGLGVPSVDAFQTPLGDIPLETTIIKDLVDQFDCINVSDSSHSEEHALEVQLPFLQRTLDSFSLIPITVGEVSEEDLGEVIDTLWGDPNRLILISSDLSHFQPYAEAQKLDLQTAHLIESFRGSELSYDSACGRAGIRGLLHVANDRGMNIERLDLRNSGDTAGPRDRVVGYGSWGFYEQKGG